MIVIKQKLVVVDSVVVTDDDISVYVAAHINRDVALIAALAGSGAHLADRALRWGGFGRVEAARRTRAAIERHRERADAFEYGQFRLLGLSQGLGGFFGRIIDMFIQSKRSDVTFVIGRIAFQPVHDRLGKDTQAALSDPGLLLGAAGGDGDAPLARGEQRVAQLLGRWVTAECDWLVAAKTGREFARATGVDDQQHAFGLDAAEVFEVIPLAHSPAGLYPLS